MRPSPGEMSRTVAQVGHHAVVGFVAPPLTIAIVLWGLVALSGMQQPEFVGLFAHFTGASIETSVEETDLAAVRTIDRNWFDSTNSRLESLGFQPAGDWVARRASYRGWFRVFIGTDPSVAAFAQQTTYPGAPPPSVAFISGCSPAGGVDPVAGATVWVETADERVPDGDSGYPPFLKIKLFPELGLTELLSQHREHVVEVCGAASRKSLREEDVVSSIKADRDWWFDWCAQSLLGMTAECRPPGAEVR